MSYVWWYDDWWYVGDANHSIMHLLKEHSNRLWATALSPMHFWRQPRLFMVQLNMHLPIKVTQSSPQAATCSAHSCFRQICWPKTTTSTESRRNNFAMEAAISKIWIIIAEIWENNVQLNEKWHSKMSFLFVGSRYAFFLSGLGKEEATLFVEFYRGHWPMDCLSVLPCVNALFFINKTLFSYTWNHHHISFPFPNQTNTLNLSPHCRSFWLLLGNSVLIAGDASYWLGVFG